MSYLSQEWRHSGQFNTTDLRASLSSLLLASSARKKHPEVRETDGPRRDDCFSFSQLKKEEEKETIKISGEEIVEFLFVVYAGACVRVCVNLFW